MQVNLRTNIKQMANVFIIFIDTYMYIWYYHDILYHEKLFKWIKIILSKIILDNRTMERERDVISVKNDNVQKVF